MITTLPTSVPSLVGKLVETFSRNVLSKRKEGKNEERKIANVDGRRVKPRYIILPDSVVYVVLDAIKVFTERIAYQLARGKKKKGRREGGRKKEAEALETWPSAAGLHSSYATIGTEPTLLAIIPLRLNFLRAFLHFLPNFCLKLILQLPPLSALQDRPRRSTSRCRALDRWTPFRIRAIRSENREAHCFFVFSAMRLDIVSSIYIFFSAKRFVVSSHSSIAATIPCISSPLSSPSSLFPSRAAALTSDFLEWEALRLHRVIRFHEGTLKFKSPADRHFFPFFPNRGWKWIYSRGNAALRRIGKSREGERRDGRE